MRPDEQERLMVRHGLITPRGDAAYGPTSHLSEDLLFFAYRGLSAPQGDDVAASPEPAPTTPLELRQRHVAALTIAAEEAAREEATA